VAWTAASFKARWPEFEPTDDAIVEGALADAVLANDARLFGARTDEAVAYYAADILSLSPGGQQARLAKNEITTTYRAMWERLARVAAGGAWTVGQMP
jgi:hypothetical protein